MLSDNVAFLFQFINVLTRLYYVFSFVIEGFGSCLSPYVFFYYLIYITSRGPPY